MFKGKIIYEEGRLPKGTPTVVRNAILNGEKVEFRPEVFKENNNCACGNCHTIYMAGWYEVHLDSRLLICDTEGNLVEENRCGIIDSEDGIYNM